MQPRPTTKRRACCRVGLNCSDESGLVSSVLSLACSKDLGQSAWCDDAGSCRLRHPSAPIPCARVSTAHCGIE